MPPCLGSVAWSPMASAHVHAGSDNPVRGAMAVVTFEVPNESNTGAATTALTVALPNVAAAHTETMPGWTARLDRDAASGTVRSVTWTAAAGGGIGPDQFALFRLSVKLPDADTVSFPATQTYADGTVVKWDQPPLPDGGEPEHPAPTPRWCLPRWASRSPWSAGGHEAGWRVRRRPGPDRRADRARGVGALATDPAADAALTTGPHRVSATFNEQLQTTFAAMTVVGPDGNVWSTGEPTVQGAVVSVAVRPLGPAGTYTANYRVTSADGHVVSGSWSFRLTVPGTGTPGPAAAARCWSGRSWRPRRR